MSHYWEGKMNLINNRLKHIKRMEVEYNDEIALCNKKAIIYNDIDKVNTEEYRPVVFLENQSLVEAILSVPNEKSVTVLNGGSFYSPARKFLTGALFDEENLCDNSYLYNVLKKNGAYYGKNASPAMRNNELYQNRALFIPNIHFFGEETHRYANVITCTPPKLTAINEMNNSRALMNRINFIKEIVRQNQTDVLIIGSFGTENPYNQNVSEMVDYFKSINRFLAVEKVIFAIENKKLYDEFVKQDFFYYME